MELLYVALVQLTSKSNRKRPVDVALIRAESEDIATDIIVNNPDAVQGFKNGDTVNVLYIDQFSNIAQTKLIRETFRQRRRRKSNGRSLSVQRKTEEEA